MKRNSQQTSIFTFPKKIISIAAMALCSSAAWAVEPFVIKDIRVEGLQRTEAGTVFSYLPVRVGDTFTDAKSTAAIKALFATGFFKDVQIEVEDNVLVVLLDERPTISTVDFVGTKEFDKDQLLKTLKDIGVGEAKIFDRSLVERTEQEIKKQYLSKGLYGAQITTNVTPIERNRVNITFNVDEGDITRIAQINIIGNKAFSDAELRDVITLSTPTWFTWYSKADQYSKQKLSGDLESIRSFYQNRGYLEMQILSTQVSLSPDKKNIYLTISLEEGDKYKVSDVQVEGDTFGREKELADLLTLKKGDVYNAARLTESVKRITDRMGNFGYAFANVNANPMIDKEKKEVAFTVFVDPGKRVYVRRINLAGNTRTRDEVIRREFRQFEGSWYDGEKIKLSRDRVQYLGFFKDDVAIDTVEVPTSQDQVDINMTVVEKSTGNLQLGAGYSSAERFTIYGSVSQVNAFGSGDTVSVDVNTSKFNRTIAVSHYDPYVTMDGVSRRVDLFTRTSLPPLGAYGYYRIQSLGGSVNYGVPFSEVDTVYFGVGVERNKIITYPDSPDRFRKYVLDYGGADVIKDLKNPFWGIGHAANNSVPLTAAWQRDSRDNPMTPLVGRYQRINAEVSAVGQFKYSRLSYKHEWYKPIYRSVIFASNLEFDYGHGLSGKPYPVFKNFYAGGIGSVRGYEPGSLGTKDSRGDTIGGAKRVVGNFELQIPFPGADKSLRWFTFFDVGNVFDDGQKIRLKDMRTAAGMGISWISPMGPLKLSYGRALNVKQGDRPQNFQITMGTGF